MWFLMHKQETRIKYLCAYCMISTWSNPFVWGAFYIKFVWKNIAKWKISTWLSHYKFQFQSFSFLFFFLSFAACVIQFWGSRCKVMWSSKHTIFDCYLVRKWDILKALNHFSTLRTLFFFRREWNSCSAYLRTMDMLCYALLWIITVTASTVNSYTAFHRAGAGAASLCVSVCVRKHAFWQYLFPDCKMCQQVIRINFFFFVVSPSTGVLVWFLHIYLSWYGIVRIWGTFFKLCVYLGSQKERRTKWNRKKLTKEPNWDSSHFLRA